jgi:hypothetical protein
MYPISNLFCILMSICFVLSGCKQKPTARTILDRSVQYHDPKGSWHLFDQSFSVKISREGQSDRHLGITLNRVDKKFTYKIIDTLTSIHHWVRDTCISQLISNSRDTIGAFKILYDCPRVRILYQTYEYLTGLPMKWLEPDARLADALQMATFDGRECWKIRTDYSGSIGTDTWYLYIDRTNYELAGYQFFHNKEPHDGEFITLSNYQKIKGELYLPSIRKWHWNRDSLHFRTDSIRWL